MVPIFGVGTWKMAGLGIRRAIKDPSHLNTWLYHKKAKNAGLGRENRDIRTNPEQEPPFESEELPETAGGPRSGRRFMMAFTILPRLFGIPR